VAVKEFCKIGEYLTQLCVEYFVNYFSGPPCTLCCVGKVCGVTQLGNVVYVVCRNSPIIRMYSADTHRPLGEGINIEAVRSPQHVVVCRHNRQLYVADDNSCIWRVSADDHSYVMWLPPKKSPPPAADIKSLSVTSRSLLVTSLGESPGLRRYSTADRQLLCVVVLPEYVKDLCHGVETTRETFIVCYRAAAQTLDEATWTVRRFSHLLAVATRLHPFARS